MAQFIVRNLEDDVRDKLRDLASSCGKSMEEMVREILRGAVMEQTTPQPPLGSQLSQRFSSLGLKQEIPELRGQEAKPPSFEL